MSMLSCLYARNENYEYAVKWANKLVQIDAEAGYFRLGWIEHYNKHFDSAISYYQKVLDINPNCTTTLHNIEVIYRAEAARKAEEAARKAAEAARRREGERYIQQLQRQFQRKIGW